MIKIHTALASALALAVLSLGALPSAHAAEASPTDAERAQLERELDETRAELRRLSQRLGEISIKMSVEPLQKIFAQRAMRAKHAVIGVTIQSVSGERGASVVAVTPDGPAAKAGLKAGDVIVAIDDLDLPGNDGEATQRLTEVLAQREPGDTVTVHFERDGQRMSETLTTEAMSGDHKRYAFAFGHDDMDIQFDGGDLPRMLADAPFDFMFNMGPWSDMELVALTPGLGDYFGVTTGLLVVRAPQDDDLDLMDGDVITKLNGQAVTSARDLLRALAERGGGDTVSFDIVRQRQAMTATARVPESDRNFEMFKFGSPQIIIHKSIEEPVD